MVLAFAAPAALLFGAAASIVRRELHSSHMHALLISDALQAICAVLLLYISLTILRALAKLRKMTDLPPVLTPATAEASNTQTAAACIECQQHGTSPPDNWAKVAGTWVVNRCEGDVDGVLKLVGYGPMARSAFKIGRYGAGVAQIDIIMHDALSCTLTFGGGPMPATTNAMRIDGTLQTFVGNEGIPGDDKYTVAMWWEHDKMVAWGEHKSGRFPRMDTRRFLRSGLKGEPHGELVVERCVQGVDSRMIYARRK